MKIGFDLDGVIVDYVGALQNKLGNQGAEGPFTYNMIEDNWFDSREQWRQAHGEVMNRCATLEVLDMSIVPALNCLRRAGHELIAITARAEIYRQGTLAQLEANGIYFDSLIMTGHRSKKSDYGLDFLVEDHPQTVLEDSATQMVIYDQPYNQSVPDTIPRVHSCMEYARYIFAQEENTAA